MIKYYRILIGNNLMATEHIENKLKLLPDKPGCYLMKDINGNAFMWENKNSKNRVRSYF